MGFVVEMLLSEGMLVSEGSINDRRAGRRSIRHAAAAFAVILLPAISTGCNRWPPGTWRLDREGWEGRLVISGDVEVDVYPDVEWTSDGDLARHGVQSRVWTASGRASREWGTRLS